LKAKGYNSLASPNSTRRLDQPDASHTVFRPPVDSSTNRDQYMPFADYQVQRRAISRFIEIKQAQCDVNSDYSANGQVLV